MSRTELTNMVEAVDAPKIRALRRACQLPEHYLDDLRRQVAPLAADIARLTLESDRPVLIGLNGCQGSGKSTLARFLCEMLHVGAVLHGTVVSIDDFYLTRQARQQLASDIHPLLSTRGVPGTHDLTLATSTLNALLDPGRSEPVLVPTFDKAVDDRFSPTLWQKVPPVTRVVILEGWCVGCPPQTQDQLQSPTNSLERSEDPHGQWRQYVNDQLANRYPRLFKRLDRLIMLRAPSFDCVYDWRKKQEAQLAQARAAEQSCAAQVMSGEALRRFIQHYERLTRHQLNVLPAHADATITLSAEHRMIEHSGSLF